MSAAAPAVPAPHAPPAARAPDAAARARGTYLIISQVYVPDPASVGQHIADAAAELARRGHRVRVIAAANGYDDPSKKYPARETLQGVDVRRTPWSSFGKSSIKTRLLAQGLFALQAFARGLFTPGLKGVMVSTSPPFCGVLGALLSRLRGVPVTYWLMDLNPDQMVAMKLLGAKSFPVRVFDFFNRVILRRAKDVVVLDRFMLERVNKKVDITSKAVVMPPWPHEDELSRIPHEQNPFRAKHNLNADPATGRAAKFVVMYSGNHSPANPIKTIVDAAERLQDDPDVVFMFIGGGGAKKDVEAAIARGAKNIVSLPYQPLSEIKYSLSAADAHVVSIGDAVVGIVHPCKVYGAMAVSRPILLLGPTPCHVSDLIEQHNIGWHLAHGDVDGAVRVIREMKSTPRAELEAMGARAAHVVSTQLSKATLCGRFCDVLENATRR